MAPKTGRIAVVLPQGALFRQGAEARIRRAFLDSDLVEAVIGLAPNLFYGTGLAASILILRAAEPPERKGKVLVINGEALFKKGRNQNTLEPEHAQQLLDRNCRACCVPEPARSSSRRSTSLSKLTVCSTTAPTSSSWLTRLTAPRKATWGAR